MKLIETILDRARVENRHSEAPKQEIGDDFEPVTVEGVQPCEGSVVARCPVGVFARLPDRGLIDASQDDDEPDVAGVEGTPLDARQGEWRNDFFRYVFDVRRRKVSVWVWYGEHIQNQTLSAGQFNGLIWLITSLGKYRGMVSNPGRLVRLAATRWTLFCRAFGFN